jgi:hypothetical protein
MQRYIHRYFGLALALGSLSGVTPALANTGIVVEAVDDYSFFLGNHTADTHLVEDATPFWNKMTAGGWTGISFWQNGDVWDTDFYDSDLTGNPADNDGWFDVPSAAISYAGLHGTCEDVTNRVSICANDSQCVATIGAGAYCPVGKPLDNGEYRSCVAEMPRHMVTSSASNSHGNIVTYGASAGGANVNLSLAIGEDAYCGGTWGNAGLNGGADVFVMINSCGARPRFLWDYNSLFAGMHMLMVHMPLASVMNSSGYFTFADAADTTVRGDRLATNILANPNAPAYQAWVDPTLVNSSYVCLFREQTHRGTCNHNEGANLVLRFDSDQNRAINMLNTETWNNVKNDESWGAQGRGSGAMVVGCNYDCQKYGM